MAYDEPYIVNRVDKDTSPSAVSSDGQRKLLPGAAFHVQNGRIITKGSLGSIGSIKGNQEIVNGNLPATGNNKVVGSFEDINDNSLIFFVYNDAGQHSIHRYYPSSNTFELILLWAGLGFTGKPIKGIGKTNDYLHWADGQLRTIDLSNLDKYNNLTDQSISLYKKPPLAKTICSFQRDIDREINLIHFDTYQFTHRYIYQDDSVSRLSPYSVCMFAKNDPDEFSRSQNYINVGCVVDPDIKDQIKKVEFFFSKNQSGQWYLAKEFFKPTWVNNIIGFDFYGDYTGYRLPESDLITDESIPTKSNNLALFKDRNFVTNNKIGLDINDFEITFEIKKKLITYSEHNSFKEGGIQSLGIKLKDKFGRNSLVKKLTDIEVRNNTAINDGQNDDGVNIQGSIRESFQVKITGSLPEWAESFQLVMTKEKRYSTYVQCPGLFLFYMFDGDKMPEGDSIPAIGIMDDSSRVYLKEKPSSLVYEIIHILIPDNLPIVPDTDMYVRIKSGSFTKIERIVDYYGDRIAIKGDFGVEDWSNTNCYQYIEIFKLAESQEELFYELPGDYYTSDLNTFIDLKGDQHIVNIDYLVDRQKDFSTGQGGLKDLDYIDEFPSTSIEYYVESPTPTVLKASGLTSEVLDLDPGGYSFKTIGGSVVLDYQKTVNPYGRVFPEQKQEGTDEQPNRLSFSNTYIEDSNINGLSTFQAINKKSIPNELSKIVALIPVGLNIMLAIHERETSSLSIGDGFIKTGDSEGILVKTESVIGDERPLRNSMGTIFPGSVQAHEGRAYYFDIYKGCVVQYTVEGLFPISRYGMENYFKELAEKYMPYKDQINIVSGIDDFNDEYLISFPPVGDLTGETWAFNYEEKTWTQHQYLPDYFGKIGNRLYSFKNGRLFEHNKTETYNNFYGVQYERSITIYANPKVRQNKRLLNAHLIIEELPTGDEYKVLIIKTENGQETYLKVKHFDKQENTFYASVMKDINSNVRSGLLPIKDGKDMRDKYFSVEIRTNSTKQNLFHSMNLVFVDSPYVR